MLVPPAFITAAVVAWDLVAPRAGYPTASYVVWDTSKHPVMGPLFVGVWAGLTWHLFFTDGRTKARHLRSPAHPAVASHAVKSTNRMQVVD